MKTKESWTAVLFLAAMAVGVCVFLYGLIPKYSNTGMARPAPLTERRAETRAALTVPHSGAPLPTEQKPLLPQVNSLLAAAEPAVNRVLDSEHWFIQLYGGAQRFIGRTVVEDTANPQYTVVKLESGALSFTSNRSVDVESLAQRLARFDRVLQDRGIPLLYIQAPSKIAPGETDSALPGGVEDTGNASADALLARLDKAGVDSLDLRAALAGTDRPWEDWFFRTDHHWTPEAAFYSYQILCDRLEKYSRVTQTPTGVQTERFTVPARYRDSARFTAETLEGWFLGSQGKRVGSFYAGADDFTLIGPRFPTWFEYTVPSQGIAKEGPFDESLLFPERVKTPDWFNGNPYTYYSGGDYPIAYIKNIYDPTGPRVILLRDSFACALTPFLALPCSELILIDLRYFHDDLLRYIDWLKPDLVFILYSTGALRQPNMFDFFAKPSDNVSFPQSKLLPEAPARHAPALKTEPAAQAESWRKRGA